MDTWFNDIEYCADSSIIHFNKAGRYICAIAMYDSQTSYKQTAYVQGREISISVGIYFFDEFFPEGSEFYGKRTRSGGGTVFSIMAMLP